MKFELSAKEEEVANGWIKAHQESCRRGQSRSPAAIPASPISFTFINTSVGTIIEVKCSCGEKKDIIDYSTW